MTFGAFRSLITSFLNRDAGALSRNGVDLILHAANQAQSWAQRAHSFELLRSEVDVTVNGSTGGQVPSNVNRIERVYAEGRSVLLDYIDRATSAARYFRIVDVRDFADESARTQATDTVNQPYSVYLSGSTLKVFPIMPPLFNSAADNTVVQLDAVLWANDFISDADSNFFLEHSSDFLQWRTLYYLNAYLKEDARVPINEKMMQTAWDELLTWDRSLAPDHGINELVTPVSK